MKSSYLAVTAALFMILALSCGSAYSSDKPVAIGHDVRVTMEFVDKVIDYRQKMSNVRPTPEERIRSGVEHWLFAREAVKTGLAEPDKDMHELEPVEVVTLHNMYLTHRMMQKAPDEKTICSYYKAFPERFRAFPAEKNSSDELPVDLSLEEKKRNGCYSYADAAFEDVREDIKRALLSGKRTSIRQDAFQELVDKYEVEIIK